MNSDSNQKGPGRKPARPKTIDLDPAEVTSGGEAARSAGEEGAVAPGAELEGQAAPEPGEAAPDSPMSQAENPETLEPAPAMTAEDEAARESVEAAHADTGQPAPEEARRDEPAPAAAPVARRRGGVVGTLVSAAAGGLIALGAVGALNSTGNLGKVPGLSGLLGAGGPGEAVPAGEGGGDLQAELAALRDKIAALEAAPSGGGNAGAEAGVEIAGRVEAVEARLQAAEAEAQQLREVLAAAPAGGGGAMPTEVSNQMNDLFARLGQAEAALGDLRQAAADPGGGEVVGDLAAKVESGLAELSGRIGEVEQAAQQAAAEAAQAVETAGSLDSRIAGIEGAVGEVKQIAEELRSARESANTEGEILARTVAANALRTAYDQGDPYAGVLASAQTLTGPMDAYGVLDRFASSGVPTPEALQADFRRASDAVMSATAPQEEGVMAQLLSNARTLVKVRPAGPQPGDSPEAVLSRVEAAIEAGDFPAALAEWRNLPENARQAAGDFAERLEARMQADDAMSQVISALAERGQG